MKMKKLAAILLALVALTLPATAAVPEDGDIRFRVFRDGDTPMGTHTLRFERRGEELHVFVDISLEVTFGFFTVFEYEHSNHEVWVGDRLKSISTKTDNNGEALFVEGVSTDEGFVVQTLEGSKTLPADVVPTSYWHPRTLEGGELLNTQTGELMEVRVSKQSRELLEIGGRQIDAQIYRTNGDLEVTLWYAPDSEWTKIAFTVRGTDVHYIREDTVEVQEALR